MKIIADTHTHSIFCDHAFSTIDENAREAASKGLSFLGVTEHATALPGAPSVLYFGNILKNHPDELHGVRLLKGAEVNIMDQEGSLDLPEEILLKLHWVIASLHTPCFTPSSAAAHTEAWLAVAENPHIDVIGHCGNPQYPFDYERVIPEFGKRGKIVEINNHSFMARKGSERNCTEIARLCAKHGVRIVVNSDSHHCSRIGKFRHALAMLEEIAFPEELVVNADYDRFVTALGEITGLDWT